MFGRLPVLTIRNMRLVSARLRNFRLFEDTGEVPIDRITVLLAQNENGKTAFLQGLAWFSAEDVEELDEEDKWQDAIRHGGEVVTLTFEREKGDAEKLKAHDIALPKTLRVSRLEGSTYRFEDADTGDRVGSDTETEAFDEWDKTRRALQEGLRTVKVSGATLYKTRALRMLENDDPFNPKYRGKLTDDNVRGHVIPELTAEDNTRITGLLDSFVAASDAAQEACSTSSKLILDSLPKLIYFGDDVETVPDRAVYEEIETDPASNRTIINLGSLAGINFARIPKDPHRRLMIGRTFQETISAETSRYWRGHPVTFELALDADAVTVSVVSQGRFQKPSRRSRGVRWYQGFHINFLAETRGELRNSVLLLDEPGLFLHPSAQEGLLDLFEEIGQQNQIVYSTHLPFMIPRKHPEWIRLLVENEDGTARVESRAHAHSDADVMKPLRAAIGMGIADTISLGARSLICEGIADLYILRAASAINDRSARTTLPKTTTILPAGGTDKILTLASFLVGEVVDGVVLVDDDTGGRRLEGQIERRFAGLVPVVRTHDTPRSEAASGMEIEDLFDDAYYCELINESHAHVIGFQPLNAGDLVGAGSLVDRVKAAFARQTLGTFQKLLPATAFAARVEAEGPPRDATLDRFAELFDRIRGARSK